MTIPYTYLIGWSNHNVWYYGVRYGKGCNPNDLWNSYFTSSKRVAQFRLEHNEPDVIQVRRVFTTSVDARLWEHDVIRRAKLINKNNFLNCHDGGKTFMNKGGYKLSERSATYCDKISESNTGKKRSDKFKAERSIQYSGHGNPNYGKVSSREKIINILKGQKKYRQFKIDGVVYELVSDATKVFNISGTTIKARLNSDNVKWDDWRYLDDDREYIHVAHGNIGRKRPDLAEFNKTIHPNIRAR